MKVEKNMYVSLAYKLTVNNEVVEDVKAEAPLDFIFGVGMLLPKFEESVAGKVVGDTFAFTLTPEESYGPYTEEAIIELPRNIFEVEGVVDESIVKPGAILPMVDNQGNQMPGKVLEVTAEFVKMDFNHPMAGKVLNFEGEVVGVREATDADMAKFMPAGGGCSCGCGEGDCGDGNCGEGGCGEDGCC